MGMLDYYLNALYTGSVVLFSSLPFSVSVSPSMLDKLGCRWAMPAGSCTAWSTASSQMDRCPLIKPSVEEMTLSTPSSARQALGSTSPELCLLTWSPLLLVSILSTMTTVKCVYS